MEKFKQSFKDRLIYIVRFNYKTHKGCLKVGQTTIENKHNEDFIPNSKSLNDAAKKRINQFTQTSGINYELLHTELATYTANGKKSSYSDNEVHKVLTRSGVERKDFNLDDNKKVRDWFHTDINTVRNAIEAIKNGKSSLNHRNVSKNQKLINFRPEQRKAIEETIKQFKSNNQMLWNAKMRFGKTICSLEVVKRLEFHRTIILTHRPVVDKGWFDEFEKIFHSKNFNFGSRNYGHTCEELESLYKNKSEKYIYFASVQDLRGSEDVGGNFQKNEEIFKTNWDLVIVDEAHEGTQTELGQNVINGVKKKDTKILLLSGTPFNLFENFKENEIYTWDYVMEQKAKSEWELKYFDSPNPYSSLPKLNIYTYDIGKELENYVDEEVAFNFREFFRVDESERFIYHKDVLSFLNLICRKDFESNYPYSRVEYRDNFRHSLWMVPGVKEARALSKLLKSHDVFKQFSIVNVAGEGDEEEPNENALEKVEKAISEDPHETYTITLSCGRLTTGVSVKAWNAVFMLSGSHNTSASAYMQTIFRVQTPAIINGKVKEECYVFDFAPDRTLKIIAETVNRTPNTRRIKDIDRKSIGDFLNFCPIISVDGSQMKPYDVNVMVETLKSVHIERIVNKGFEDKHLYNLKLLEQLSVDELEKFSNLKKEIGRTKSIPKVNEIYINDLGFATEEYESIDNGKPKKALTLEEKARREEIKELRKRRDVAISILRGISIRLPLLIYGLDLSSEQEISVDNVVELIDNQSWFEFMPKGVTKKIFADFKKYYDSDVFRASCRRIIEKVNSADKLTIECRIERITDIFGTFKNPDKETVLTPWRVVNMHLSDCLGGYYFLDEYRKKTKNEPSFVSHDDITENVYSSNAKILDLNSKSGLYLLYATYNIFRKRLSFLYPNRNPNTISLSKQWDIWNKTVTENIFAICKTPMAKKITVKTLIGSNDVKVNVRHFKNLPNQVKFKTTNFLNKVRRGKSYWKTNKIDKMKFNAIIGNPPYQENISNSQKNSSLSKQLFPDFVKIGIRLKPTYLSLITPSRWFTGDAQDKSFIKLREYMKTNNNISKLFNYKDSKDIFPRVEIKGGGELFFTPRRLSWKSPFYKLY